MIPTAFLFSRYRAFEKETRLDLASLTVIIGKNGGGKSVLTRVPLIICAGLSANAEAPIALDAGGVIHASRFEDLIFQRSSFPFMLGAEAHYQGTKHLFKSTLLHVQERHSVALISFELFIDEKLEYKIEISDLDQIENHKPIYRFSKGSSQEVIETQIHLIGLFPDWVSCDEAAAIDLARYRSLFQEAFSAPSYLGPFRAEHGTLARIPAQGVRELGPRGERALDMLGDDVLRHGGRLAADVGKWFEDAMGGNRVSISRLGDLPRITVNDPIRNMDVDLSETGAGCSQVLPIVVQAFARMMGVIRTPILITEQPELHLHPAAHGDVADLLLGAALGGPSPTLYVCETHSEQFIMRIRRRIAEGRIDPALIQLLSVGHRSNSGDDLEPIRRINLDADGNPDAWPLGVFDEAFQDLALLRKAVRERPTPAQGASA